MDYRKSEVTRYLASCAIRLGRAYRDKILNFVNQDFKAFAPEFGFDLATVIRMCRFIETRETKYQLAFLLLGILISILSLTEFLLPGALIIFFIAWILRFYKGTVEHNWLLDYFQRDKYDPDIIKQQFDTWIEPKILSAIDDKDQNLIVYKGFRPFVGSGILLSGWSFPVDITKPKKDFGTTLETKSFPLTKLYNEIYKSFDQLNFKWLQTQHVLFTDGSDIRGEKWILPNIFSRPVKTVDQEKLHYYAANSDQRIRYYTALQVYDWGNDLILTYFLRFSRQGKKLFVEVSVFVLTPLTDKHKGVDKLVPYSFTNFLAESVKHLILTPLTILTAPAELFNKLTSLISKYFQTERRMNKKLIMNNPLYNYGASNTLREQYSSIDYDHYFQLLDKEMYTKIIEQELLDSIIRFLDEHNIDTSELESRQTTIINSGIIVKDGNVNAESLAVGKGAKAKKKVFKSKKVSA